MEVSQKPFARKTPDQLVYLELGAGNGGMLLSASEEGFRFRAVSPLHPNGLVPFAFSFDGTHRLQGVGEIEWLDDDGRSGGMRFADVSSEFRAALDQWLVSPSRQVHSGREVTPVASVPPDTMEKIREELRRGYPPREESSGTPPPTEPSYPPQPALQDGPSASPTFAPETETGPHQESLDKTKPQATPGVATRPEREVRERHFPARTAIPAASRPLRPRFSQRAEDPSAASRAPKAQGEAPAPPSLPPAANAAPPHPAATVPTATIPLPQFSAGATLFTAPTRPHIPPIDESFEAAWEHAKLTAPLEAPHLNRAAASSIIGLALAVICAALAYNFHQEIGEKFIEFGQKISGQAVPGPHGAEAATEVPPARDTGNAEAKKASEENSPAPAEDAPAPAPANSASASEPDSAGSDGAKRGAAEATKPSTPRGSGTTDQASASRSHPRPQERAQLPKEAEPQPAQDSGSGQEEFAEAREILRGVHRRQDLSRAVDLLWAGVRKGYVPAEVTLADLYRRGDGVERNCDQAQVLLVAASKKGSPEARRVLEQMAEQGCE